MKRSHFAIRPDALCRVALTLFGAAIVATILASASPAMASAPRAVSIRVAPAYPLIAKNVKLAGPVEFDVTVDPTGKVTDVKTLSGNPMLAAAAKKALQKWQFAPSLTASNENVKVNFNYHTD